MENQIKWHHGVPSEEQYHQAQHELDTVLQSLID
jgi:transketolase